MRINLFSQRPAHDPAVVGRGKGWVRELLGLGGDVTQTVMQHKCARDNGHDVETVGGVLEQGNPRRFTVLKPLAEVTRDDLAMVLRELT